MNIPKIYLYDDRIGHVEYVDHVGTDLTIVNSARVSFGSHKEELDDKDKKLISYLIKHKHTSTLEHCFVTFRVKVPLFIRSQHHRHRTWSYNEISRRYTPENLEFYLPNKFRTQSTSNRQASNVEELINPEITWYEHDGDSTATAHELMSELHEKALWTYEKLLAAGVCREQARGVLPQNLYTEYYASCNVNNLLKFIQLRLHEGAQWEIQQVAKAMLDIAENLWPITITTYREINNF